MEIIYTEKFKKLLNNLQKDIKDIFYRQEKILKNNFRDNRLHLKKLKFKEKFFLLELLENIEYFFILEK